MKISKRSKITSSKETADRKTDRRIFPTNVRYKGYMIRLDRGGDGYNVYDKHGELEDAGYTSLESAKKLVDELVAENKKTGVEASSYSSNDNWVVVNVEYKLKNPVRLVPVKVDDINNKEFTGWAWGERLYTYNKSQIVYESSSEQDAVNFVNSHEGVTVEELRSENIQASYHVGHSSNWTELESKSVLDSDGFYTDYTLYTNGSTFICMFGDNDIYEPDEAYADYETENEEEAYDWFDNYEGFADEDDAEPEFDIYASESDSDEDDLDHPYQEFDSAKTSINSKKLPAVYRMIHLQPGTVGVDFGGGRWDSAVEYLRDQDVTLCVYDPYNRSAEHNREVLRTLRANGGADFAINSNVLNVIKEPEARKGVLENIKKITKSGAPIYITVYEGRGDAKEGVTKSGYQLNRKTADYLEEIQEVFPDATRKGKLIVATNSTSVNSSVDTDTTERWAQRDLKDDIKAATSNLSFYCPRCHNKTLYSLENEIRSPMDVDYREIFVCDECASEFEAYPQYDGSIKFKEYYGEDVDASSRTVNSSTNIKASSEIIWDDLDWDQQIQVMKRYIRNYKGTRIFEDFADYINKPVEDIIDSFTDAESYGDIKIPERKQLDSEYRNDDIYSSTTSSSRYWYFTRHGVQPGSVPKYVNILDIVDKPEGSYFLADGVILTKDLRDYDIKERKPEDSVTSSKRIKSKGNNQYTDADIIRSSKSIGKYFGLIYYTPDSGENGMEGDKFDLSDCGEFNSIEEANEFWNEYLLRDKGQAFVAEITKEEYEDWLAESELQKDWESSYKQSHDTVNGSTNEYSDILEEIREQCNTKLIHIMAQYGFDESEAKQYSRVDASIEDNQYGRIEIGCELDYDGLMRVCQELDPIVQAYDTDSYFEPVDSGIAEAWINLEKASIDSSSNIQAGAYDFPEPSLDPPEYPEPEEVDDYTQKIDLNLDAVIEIDQLGDWEYQDENYPWARCKDTKDGSWYSDEYDVFIADPVSIVERVDELLISKLPEKEGTYRIKGNVHLEYVVSNLSKYVHSYGPDDYEEDIDTDNAYVDFDFYNSNISNFRLKKM